MADNSDEIKTYKPLQTYKINKKKNIPKKRNFIAVPEVRVVKQKAQQATYQDIKKDSMDNVNIDISRNEKIDARTVLKNAFISFLKIVVKGIVKIILGIRNFVSITHLGLNALKKWYSSTVELVKRYDKRYVRNIISNLKCEERVNNIFNKLGKYKADNKLKMLLQNQKRLSYITGAVAAAVLMTGIVVSANYRPGVEVFVNDQIIGILHNEEEYNNYLAEVTDEVSKYVGAEVEIEQKPKLVKKIVRSKAYTPSDTFKASLKSIFDESIGAYAILVDGKMITAVADETTAYSVLEELKKPYMTADASIKIEFDKDVQVQKMTVKVGDVKKAEEALAALSASEEEVKTYVVKPKDTLWNIARNHDMLVDEILAMNPGLTDAIKPDQEIYLSVPKPVVGVKTIQTVVFNEKIPFDINKIEDPNTYQGRSSVVEEGVEGEKRVEAEVVKVNGIEVERKIINEVVLSQPKPQTLKVGTKPLPPKYGTGVFGRPSYGTLSSRFGKRRGENHTGIDLAGKIGDPIYASDGGKVIFAGWEGGYGKLVKIDHGNGFVTYYGHCSSILVKVGDRVAKGEVIAKVGSTGRSTGPHVHFEVRKNGVPQNPLNYLK